MARVLKTVLVVDDDETILRAVSRGLRAAKKTVFTTTDPAHALRLAKAEQPDLAIVDLRLGRSSGVELVRQLKHDRPDLVVVMVSGYLNVPVAVEAMKAGATEVLFKPITDKEILERVEEGVRAPSPDLFDTPSLDRVTYEHAARVVADCGGNISMAARKLGVHRQSLQRRLRKPAPKT